MANLSYSQMESDDLQAGWPAQLVATAAAIEEAESSGNPAALGPGGSWGTFQIQPQYHTNLTQTDNPVTQAQDALTIYNAAGGFGPWSTFNEGTYKQFLPAAQAAVGQAGTAASGSQASQSGSCDVKTGTYTGATCSGFDLGCGLGNVMGGVSCRLQWIQSQATIALQIGVGMVVVAVGFYLLVRDTAVGKAITNAAQNAAGTAKKVGMTAAKAAAA